MRAEAVCTLQIRFCVNINDIDCKPRKDCNKELPLLFTITKELIHGACETRRAEVFQDSALITKLGKDILYLSDEAEPISKWIARVLGAAEEQARLDMTLFDDSGLQHLEEMSPGPQL
ncbi:hypothetical protein Y1Q_0017216 [Alligator mississippiensis]|uniref:Uncharacterized protein n=1 Tax=Alligator mississippiensis TaxID=8496 RepID=A0A151NKR6_ALLMI|nr:hypothetical protein Y1Q_0017216 [Alligator mississippiensis]